MKRILLSTFVTLLFGGCMSLQRHPGSGYAGHWDDVGEPSYGTKTRTLSQEERGQLEGDIENRRLESTIRSDEEYDQYNRYKGSMSAKERGEFLAMKDTSARRRWVQAKGIREDQNRFSRNIASVIEDGDITLGMPKEAVRESWGDPESIEVAGNPSLGNERWIYTRYMSSVEGYQREERVIYFERGQVIGWERR
jgi:hypothetical protein